MEEKQKNYILLFNPNNLAVKINFNTPIYAHFDRTTYTALAEDNLTEIEKHKCVLHIDTNLKNTSFEDIIYTVSDSKIGTLSHITDEDESKLVLQDDSAERIDTKGFSVNATYKTKAFEKSTIFFPNKTIVCSGKLKVHNNLHPFNYDKVFNTEEDNNNE